MQICIAANCPEFISKDKFTGLKPLDYHVWGSMLDLYQKYQPRPTYISELKVALQSILPTLRPCTSLFTRNSRKSAVYKNFKYLCEWRMNYRLWTFFSISMVVLRVAGGFGQATDLP